MRRRYRRKPSEFQKFIAISFAICFVLSLLLITMYEPNLNLLKLELLFILIPPFNPFF